MPIREMLGLFAVLVSPTVAMVTVEDAELAGVRAGACTMKCSPNAGNTCPYVQQILCEQAFSPSYPVVPIGCQYPGHSCSKIVTAAVKDDLCVRGDPNDTCVFHDAACVQKQYGTCQGSTLCLCNVSGPVQTENGRAACQ